MDFAFRSLFRQTMVWVLNALAYVKVWILVRHIGMKKTLKFYEIFLFSLATDFWTFIVPRNLKLFSSTLDYCSAQFWFSISTKLHGFFFSLPLSLSFTLIQFFFLLSCRQATNHNYIAKCTSFSIKCMRKYMRTYILLFVQKQ